MEEAKDWFEEYKRKSRQFSPELSAREKNRVKSITQGLKKSFKGASRVVLAREYWLRVLEEIANLESERRRNLL